MLRIIDGQDRQEDRYANHDFDKHMSLPEISGRVYELADKIASDALESEDQGFRLDAFKALSTFFIGTSRISAKLRDDEDEGVGVSLPQMQARIAEAAEGNGAEKPLVSSARRRAAGEPRERDRNGKFE